MTRRFREIGTLPDSQQPGLSNSILDVEGLTLGHHTLIADAPRILRTGVTVLRIPDVLARPVAAGVHVLNGYGKSMGLVQVEELGTLESDLYLTNTLSIGAVQQGAVRAAQQEKADLCSFNAVVLECNDSHLSDIGALAVTPEMALAARENAGRDCVQGSVGAGTGMVCFGFKGGIGSASRRVEIAGRSFTVGALVLSNFGRREDLRLPGLPSWEPGGPGNGQGSLIMVVATDLPLMPHQLKRVARHMPLAIGLLGCPGHPGSGDIALALSTTMRFGGGEALATREVLADDHEALVEVFRAAAWSTAEAILDSMFASPTMTGLRGTVEGIGGWVKA